MAQVIDKLVEKKVQVLTSEGRIYQGCLKSFDQRVNIILDECEEHIYESDHVAMRREPLGAFLIRGDNIAVVGEVDSMQPKVVYGCPIEPMQLH